MVDIVDKEIRSRIMSGRPISGTKPEILTRKALHRTKYRYRLNSKVGKIKPDIVLRCYKVAVFVHGCFWHQHEGCKLAYSDNYYKEEWLNKFQANKQRDKRVLIQLTEMGWRVAVIWECVTRDKIVLASVIEQLHLWIQSNENSYFESNYRKI